MDTTEKFDVFPGIVNENEFYSHHFFAHVFQSRIKEWLQQHDQKTQAEGPAPKRLAGHAAPFFQRHARYPWDEDFSARLQWHRDLHRDLLQALGFRLAPQEQEWVTCDITETPWLRGELLQHRDQLPGMERRQARLQRRRSGLVVELGKQGQLVRAHRYQTVAVALGAPARPPALGFFLDARHRASAVVLVAGIYGARRKQVIDCNEIWRCRRLVPIDMGPEPHTAVVVRSHKERKFILVLAM